MRPFFYPSVAEQINSNLIKTEGPSKEHLQIVMSLMEGQSLITAGTKTLNRYSVLPGKTFASSPKSKTKYKVLRLVADDVVIQDISSQKVETVQINKLLKRWAEEGVQEISLLDDIVSTVKSILGPALGVFLTAALISWIQDKLG